MYKKVICFIGMTLCIVCTNVFASNLDVALRDTYTNCVGIDEALHDMKVKAGINTAVTGVGTGLGIGAVVVGVAKKNVDAALEDRFKTLGVLAYSASGDVETMSGDEWLEMFTQSNKTSTDENLKQDDELKKEHQRVVELTAKSKKLGAWRTGLLAGNTATNAAGAFLSGKNKIDVTIQEQILACKLAVKNLRHAIAQARIEEEDVTEAVEIESACDGFETIDAENIEKINKRATSGMVSALVGTGTGVVGTITSAVANSDKIRKDDSDKGKQKEKNLNTAANVFAVGSTVASATATVFNAIQIRDIKNVVSVAEKCTGALR